MFVLIKTRNLSMSLNAKSDYLILQSREPTHGPKPRNPDFRMQGGNVVLYRLHKLTNKHKYEYERGKK